MDSSGFQWALINIGGPVLLGVVLLWALLRNRSTTKSQVDRSEQATREQYDEEDAAHRGESDGVP